MALYCPSGTQNSSFTSSFFSPQWCLRKLTFSPLSETLHFSQFLFKALCSSNPLPSYWPDLLRPVKGRAIRQSYPPHCHKPIRGSLNKQLHHFSKVWSDRPFLSSLNRFRDFYKIGVCSDVKICRHLVQTFSIVTLCSCFKFGKAEYLKLLLNTAGFCWTNCVSHNLTHSSSWAFHILSSVLPLLLLFHTLPQMWVMLTVQ